MVTITTTVGHQVVQMSEEAFEAHEAELAREAARKRALRRAFIRQFSPLHWLRRWSERRALRRFVREREARLGTARQALTFALDASEDDVGDSWDRLGFLETWREGGDLSEWPAYQPQDEREGRS